MRLANFAVDGQVHVGSVVNGQLFDFANVGESMPAMLPASIEDALGNWEEARGDLQKSLNLLLEDKSPGKKSALKIDGVKFLPPVRNPSKILCVFVNYRSHGQEVGSAPSEPVFFFKHSQSLVGDGDEDRKSVV